jgi:hypothetical protein
VAGARPACPECGKEFDRPGQVTFHRIAVHKYRAASKAAKARTPGPSSADTGATDTQIEKDVRKAVGYVQGFGAILKMGPAQHTGTAIMGVEAPKGTAGALEDDGRVWYVRSRAVMAQPTLIDQARRNVQIYRIIVAFNQFCESGVIIEAAAGIAAAVAVDAGVPVNVGLKLGPIPMRPIPLVIPDVLEWVAYERERAAAEAEAGGGAPPPTPAEPQQPANGEAPGGEPAEVIAGDVTAT